MKDIRLGALSIPITQFASQGNAVLGIRDSGKTYSATYLGEQLLKAGIPFVAFDPSGVWKFLRVPGAGAGYPVVVAGGKAPDLPLTPASAPEIVRAAMRSNVSLVVDLYDIHISKADWSRIVESCVRVLLYENGEHGLRHVFIEEAAEFAPQNVQGDKAKVYAEVEKLARIGGNALLGYTLINQRAEQVNKAVLELCDCLFLHRQKGKNSLTSLAKWLEYSQGSETKEIIRSLPTLPSGECWIWPANADHATHVKMPEKQSFHPDRRALVANPKLATADRVDAHKFVEQLKGTLDKYMKEAQANDPAALKKQIAELQRQLKAKPIAAAVDDEAVNNAAKRGFDEGLATMAREFDSFFKAAIHGPLAAVADELRKIAASPRPHAKQSGFGARPENPERRVETHRPAVAPQESRTGTALTVPRSHRQIDGRAPSNGTGEGEVGTGGKRRILTALAQQAKPIDQRRLSLLTGLSARSGTWSTYLSALRHAGYIEGREALSITSSGLSALGDFEPLPTGRALIEYWRQRLGESGKRAIFDAVVEVYPSHIDQESVASAANLSARSGTWSTYLSELRGLGLIEGRGELRASEDLF